MLLTKSLAFLLLTTYSILILYFIYGWLKGKTFKKDKKPFLTQVSIIVAARNEQHSILPLLQDLTAQQYPGNLFEVIVMDDSSEDNTLSIAKELAQKHNNIRVLNCSSKGKKEAISEGILNSQGDLIITTDADCRMSDKWLSSIVSFYELNKPEMIIAPVCLNGNEGFFEKMQSLEFLSLSGITGASALNGKPLLCSGANLAYTKKAFLAVDGFKGGGQTPSGDDMMLMIKFKKAFAGKIGYLKSEEAVVYTAPQKTVKDFFNQRKRWISKNRYYNDSFISFCAWIVLLFNGSISVFLPLTILNKGFAEILVISFSLKLFIDFLFLFLTASFFKRKTLLWLYLPAQLLYMLYVPIASIAGFTGKFTWKGRIYK